MRSLPGDLLALANRPRGRSSPAGSTDQITLVPELGCVAAVPTRQKKNSQEESSKNQQKSRANAGSKQCENHTSCCCWQAAEVLGQLRGKNRCFFLWPGASPYLRRKKWGEGDDELLRLSPSACSLLFSYVLVFFPLSFFPSVLASSGFFY